MFRNAKHKSDNQFSKILLVYLAQFPINRFFSDFRRVCIKSNSILVWRSILICLFCMQWQKTFYPKRQTLWLFQFQQAWRKSCKLWRTTVSKQGKYAFWIFINWFDSISPYFPLGCVSQYSDHFSEALNFPSVE